MERTDQFKVYRDAINTLPKELGEWLDRPNFFLAYEVTKFISPRIFADLSHVWTRVEIENGFLQKHPDMVSNEGELEEAAGLLASRMQDKLWLHALDGKSFLAVPEREEPFKIKETQFFVAEGQEILADLAKEAGMSKRIVEIHSLSARRFRFLTNY